MKNQNFINWPIILSSLLLISIGILVIYSSSHELALQQLIFALLGIAVFLVISKLDLQSFYHLIKPLYFLTVLLLMAVLMLGFETRGTLRWISFGIFNIQPSEIAKPILILFLAKFWSEQLPSWLNILKSFFWMVPLFLLVFKQPDLGSSLTILAIWTGMLLAAKISFKKILVLFLIFAMIIPVSWMFLQDYQKERIVGFFSPESDPLGKGYNLIQSRVAVGSGEILGRGLGRGTQSRLQFLPEFRTDFIFASIAEELGFVGAVLILSLYLFLLLYSLKSSLRTRNSFSFFVILGVVTMFVFQVFVNIGMNVGLLPITGITLPLISYGGSSLITTLVALGMLTSSIGTRQVPDVRQQ